MKTKLFIYKTNKTNNQTNDPETKSKFKNISVNSFENEEHCDIKKVLNCFLFLKKNNLIKNQYTNYSNKIIKNLETVDSNKSINTANLFQNNLNIQNDPLNKMNQTQNNNNLPISNNITNNYNYILNNYNVNITPNESSVILKNISKIDEKQENSSSKKKNLKLKKFEKDKKPFNQNNNGSNGINKKTNKTKLFVTIEDIGKEKKSLENKRSDSFIFKREHQKDNQNDLRLKNKIFKSPFTLEKIHLQANSENKKFTLEEISEKTKNSFQSSETERNKLYKIDTNFKIKRNKISLKNITKKKELEKQEFNCYNEFYRDSDRNDNLKKDLEKYSVFYEEDLQNILKDKKHFFMNSHFPEMYNKKDNFYLNIKLLNKKRKTNALINSAYQRKKNFLSKNLIADQITNTISQNKKYKKTLVKKNIGNLNTNKNFISDVYDIFFNMENKNNLILSINDIDGDENINSCIKEIRDNSSDFANDDIEINLNSINDSDSNHSSDIEHYRNKSLENNKYFKNKYEFCFNDPNYKLFNQNGTKIINTVDCIDFYGEKKDKNIANNSNIVTKKNFSINKETNLKHDYNCETKIKKIWDNRISSYEKSKFYILFIF